MSVNWIVITQFLLFFKKKEEENRVAKTEQLVRGHGGWLTTTWSYRVRNLRSGKHHMATCPADGHHLASFPFCSQQASSPGKKPFDRRSTIFRRSGRPASALTSVALAASKTCVEMWARPSQPPKQKRRWSEAVRACALTRTTLPTPGRCVLGTSESQLARAQWRSRAILPV